MTDTLSHAEYCDRKHISGKYLCEDELKARAYQQGQKDGMEAVQGDIKLFSWKQGYEEGRRSVIEETIQKLQAVGGIREIGDWHKGFNHAINGTIASLTSVLEQENR